ncbi:MAG: hypothetical protein AAF329_00425 [Cyanobacteria bacterium P01_A01_bin.17]
MSGDIVKYQPVRAKAHGGPDGSWSLDIEGSESDVTSAIAQIVAQSQAQRRSYQRRMFWVGLAQMFDKHQGVFFVAAVAGVLLLLATVLLQPAEANLHQRGHYAEQL